MALLNNYGVALTLAKKWSSGLPVFQKLTKGSSPQTELLLNYVIFLAEKSKEEKKAEAMESLISAKGIVDELTLYNTSVRLKRKVRRLSQWIGTRMKDLKSASLKR